MEARLERAEAAGTRGLRSPGSGPAPQERLPLTLQRLAGNRATTLLIQRQVATAASTRPTLRRGDVEQMVGVLQQKLTMLGGQSLVVDAEFGPATVSAVRRFQRAHPPLTASGVADADTWAALDALVPGGDLQADGSLSAVAGHAPPDPSGTTEAGTDVKPVLRQGSRGVAVAELHEKLNQLGASLPAANGLAAADTLEFTADTEAAVRTFQRAHRPLADDGVVGRRTWTALNAAAPASTMGRTDEFMHERARGTERGTQVAYDWAIEPDRTLPARLVVRVRYDYQDDPAAPLPDRGATVSGLLTGITSIWNVFKAVEQPVGGAPPRPDVLLDFDPREGTPADKAVVLSGTVGHSNAGHYFITPGINLTSLSAHEFGHHFGLQDEYQQTAADHRRQTGEAAPVGDWQGDGTAPEVVARELHGALHTPPRADHGVNTLAVIQSHNITQGAFAQRVADRYRGLYGISVIADCNRLIDESQSEGNISNQRRCTSPFMYTAGNLMGGAETHGTTHEHEVAPRHVRHLCAILGQAVGGIWEPARR